jgi:Sugar transport protein
VVWGVLAGCLWAVANTLTIFKIRDVGLSIAFPLWNMNSLIGILWGVTLFNELRNTGARRWLSVLGGALLMFAGACLLACASSAQTTPEHAMRGIVAALAAGVLWGTMYIPYRKAYLTGMNPLSFVAFFTIGELVTMTILALTSRGGAIPLYFRCVITHADHRISSQIGRMLQHQFKGVFASLLAQIGQQGYVAADIVCRVAPMVPTMDLERTMIPRTSPRLRTMA